jgi:uncharacterized protein (DUF952 family)
MQDTVIYKIVRGDEWQTFQKTKTFSGSALDRQDGFIHCSTQHQWPKVKEKFFKDEKDVYLLTLTVTPLQPLIKWEESPRSGEVYPHLYGSLPLAAVVRAEKLETAA